MNFDDNALFRHPDIQALRDLDEEDPTEVEAVEARPLATSARRQHRLHGERRGAGDGDDGHHQALRRRPGELPRRRRRRERGTGRRTAFKIILSDPKREGDPREHLRRDHAVRRHRRRRSSRRRRQVGLKVPLVVRLEGTNVEQGREILAASGLNIIAAADMGDAAKKVVGRRQAGRTKEGESMSILVDKNTRVLVQGITGSRGRVPREAVLEYGTKIVGGVTPGKGGTRSSTASRSSTPWPRRSRATGANASVIFVPPPFAADAILEAADAGIDARRLHHRGHSGPRHGRVTKRFLERKTTRLIGPNCPGVITPGECKIGIMPGHIHRPGRSASSPARHADLRGGAPADRSWASGSRPASASAAIPIDGHELHRCSRRSSRPTRRPRPSS